MKKLIALILFLGLIRVADAQEIQVVSFGQLEPMLMQRNDTTYVVNFWATWCLPCVKEMPHFQLLHDSYAAEKVKVVLVSLDFVRQIETRLIPFITKHNLTPEVLVLNDPDANSWIEKVSPLWSGALPATVVYNRSGFDFYEKSFTYPELEEIVKQKLNNL